MDVEENQVEFELTPIPDQQSQYELAAQFEPFPFTHETRGHILARRSVMSDELVFDLLLEQASIVSPQSLYPPDSPESLLQLLDAIANCPWDILKKSCLQFYLLSHVSPTVAAHHAVTCALPPQFVHLAHACFLLDVGSVEDLARAVALLSDARIVQDLSSKILHTLSLAPQPHSSRLVRTYVRTSQPVLEEYEDLAIYLRALLEYSLADAWSFQRTFSELTPTRNRLIRTVLDSCLIPPKPAVLPHFLSLPLTSFEFSLLQSYALTPPEELSPAAHAILQDLITVRLLHSGKYSDAVRISRAFDTLNAKSRSAAASPLHKAAEERQQMMRDILAVVPEVQRRQLELELNEEQRDLSASSLSASWTSAGNDVSMSWESLGTSMSAKIREKTGGTRASRLEGSPVPALPERSHIGARFGQFTLAGSAHKRKVGPNATTDSALNLFGTPTKDAPPHGLVPPQIPTSGLATSSSVTPIGLGFRQSSHLGLPPWQNPLQQSQAGNGRVSPLGIRPNGRNAFHEPQPSRAVPSLFARQDQNNKGTPFATSTRRVAGDTTSELDAQKTPVNGNPAVGRQNSPLETEDIVMIDSDDPDAFVVRGNRRPPTYPPTQDSATHANEGPDHIKENGDTRLSRLPVVRNSDEGIIGGEENKVLPGGFASADFQENAQVPSSSRRGNTKPALASQNEPNLRRTRVRPSSADAQPFTTSPRIKIPGALFEEVEEEQDQVPSLPPVPPKGGRKRTSRTSSVATNSEEDDTPRTPLRRSSRLSSAGLSPEPISPKRPREHSRSKKMASRKTQADEPRQKRKEK